MTERFVARFPSRSARATQALGARLGKALLPGDVVALVGDLGAGKTQLVRGACDGAAVPPEEVSSPSFAIVASYRGRLPVHHADLYRIADEDELYGTGFGDLVGGDGALLVEWADRIPGALPEERLTIRLSHDARAPGVRHVVVEGMGERHAALARVIAPARRARRSLSSGRSRGRGRGDGAHETGSRTGSKPESRSASKSASGSRSGSRSAPSRSRPAPGSRRPRRPR